MLEKILVTSIVIIVISVLLNFIFSKSKNNKKKEAEKPSEVQEEIEVDEHQESPEEMETRLNNLKKQVIDKPFTKIGITEESSHYLETFGLEEEEKDLHLDD